MEFDKSRVYSAVNADELSAGDKVIVADQLSVLKQRVQEGKENSAIVLQRINGEDWGRRFGLRMSDFALAYLVERAENCTNCGEGRWDAEHKKIFCDPVNCGNGNVVFRNHEIEVCEYWKPITKQKVEKHTDYNHCEEARKAYAWAMTNACPNKHYRPFRDTDELLKAWEQKHRELYPRPAGTMPLIWVRYKDKHIPQKGTLIRTFFEEAVSVDEKYLSLETLVQDYEFLDGSVCGVEE